MTDQGVRNRSGRGLKRLTRAIGMLGRLHEPDMRFRILVKLGAILAPQYRFKWPQMAWWQDQWFNRYLERFGELGGLNTDRRWMLSQLARLIERVPGDTAECGVLAGAGSFAVLSETQRENDDEEQRTHFVFDSFSGLSMPGLLDGHHWKEADLACPIDVVRRNLSEFPRVSYHQGWIPERFADVADRTFAFVHIDVDLYEPTLDSIAFFYPRMSAGGIIVCDDYGFTTCPGASKAIDEFLQDKPEKMIASPCGGGYLVRGPAVGRNRHAP